ILVKLWQFDPEDRTPVRLDTTGLAFAAAPGRAGVEVLPLFADAREDVRLERWAPGTEVALGDPGGVELFVLAGAFTEAGQAFEPQSWLRLPPGETATARAGPAGCRLWVKSGHLAAPPPLPPGTRAT
ncbi:MAG TPA: cupin domain-containing protein, partial [Caulobacteraceae bacterium]|nr:cupin domain-containing protein [Caulobacteraceae bacterium]